jgi:asparagine synthase (glutamine-hydrolysing)
MNIQSTSVIIKEKFLWQKFILNNDILWFKGHLFNHSVIQLIEDLQLIENNNLVDFFSEFDGFFAAVFKRQELVIALVDSVCSIPLFYSEINGVVTLDSHAPSLVKKEGLIEFNNDAILALSMSGFTINKDTIYKELIAIKPGHLIVFENEQPINIIQNYQYQPWKMVENSRTNYQKELAKITLEILKKVIKELNGRQVIIPLSAGNDSRLIASGLKHLGYHNVKCYSYGTKGNFESKVAKKVAQKLGYEYKFLPLVLFQEKKFYKSTQFMDYLDFADNCMAIPPIQSLSTIKQLKEIGWVDNDAVFINGNSGDFISGAHVDRVINKIRNKISVDERKNLIFNEIINKHYSLWGNLKTQKNLKNIETQLRKEMPVEFGKKINDHGFYEYSEFLNRQSKYVINNQRVYEFYGFDWRMPLWDIEYLKFWEKIPPRLKKKQNLYIQMLHTENWGDVWNETLPVNKKTLRPVYLIPLRLFFKVIFSIFGSKGKLWWHQFDINVFFYWRDVNRMMAEQSYFRVLMDIFKKPKNHMSWQTKKYIQKKINKSNY